MLACHCSGLKDNNERLLELGTDSHGPGQAGQCLMRKDIEDDEKVQYW